MHSSERDILFINVVQGRQLLDENLEGLVLPAALLQQTASALGAPGDQGVRGQAAAMLKAMGKGLDSRQEASAALACILPLPFAAQLLLSPCRYHLADCLVCQGWIGSQALPVM